MDSITGISALTRVTGTAGLAGNPSADGGLSALRAQGVDAGRQPGLAHVARLDGAEGVSAIAASGMQNAKLQPWASAASMLNNPEGPSVQDMVQLQMGLMNYSMSMTIMAQSHKKISESKSALMNEGKNA